MANTPKQQTGNAAEERAVAHLRAAGLTIVARNWRCRAGELDIVARDPAGTLVFIEVRARASAAFGGAAASIGAAKQLRLARAAEIYRQATGNLHRPCRFDAVLIEAGALQWVRDAFQIPG